MICCVVKGCVVMGIVVMGIVVMEYIVTGCVVIECVVVVCVVLGMSEILLCLAECNVMCCEGVYWKGMCSDWRCCDEMCLK